MQTKSSDTATSSLGLQMLTIAFIVLKLLGVITWSWVWVLSPLWIPVAVVLVILAVVLIVHKLTR